ncbi:extracellular solute-binding protein [Bradyrhizobium sp. UFLA05-153]
MELKRRELLQGAAALGVVASLPFAPEARAKEMLTVVEWGPPYIEGSKKVAAKWDKADIAWELHAGGAAAILGKLKATWPNSPYDLVDNWSPIFYSMVKEGWAETVTLADVPSLADVPEKFLTKDDKGNIKNVPRSLNTSFFFVRTDQCPIEIKIIEDLLNPKLKGLISWPSPIMQTNMQTVALALARGGNERNLDPGWKFLEELATSGNIGRVYQTNTDIINSMTTGETCITFASQASFGTLAKTVPVKPLTKVDPSLKAAVYVEGWVIMANSKKKKAAMEFANFMVSRDSSQLFHQYVGNVPANQKAKPGSNVVHVQFTPEEFDKFAYLPDWAYMSTQLDAWVKKFEQEIAPKI